MSANKEFSPKEKLDLILKTYLEENIGGYSKSNPQNLLELETRFGKGMKITRTHYDQVVNKLLSSGFAAMPRETLLRIGTEYLDENTGLTKQSNVRVELKGMPNVSKYCKTDNLLDENQNLLPGTKFVKKGNFKGSRGYVDPADFWDYNFRVAFQQEQNINSESNIPQNILQKWSNTRKTFRYINRNRLLHKDLPFAVDISIVKESKKRGKQYVPEYNFRDSGVLVSAEMFEIEIEVINNDVGIGTSYDSIETLGNALRKVIKTVLCGLQGTNYPISKDEKDMISNEYLELIEKKEKKFMHFRDFIGPSSLTLELKNVVDLQESKDLKIPNIRKDYTVTDKADGERKLMYISKKGKLYLIDTNMNIQFTGAITKNNSIFNTLIDGEHILHNKYKAFINLYAAFDIYYLGGKDVRNLSFAANNIDKEEESVEKDKVKPLRLEILTNLLKKNNAESVTGNSISPLRIEMKKFYRDSASQTIFQGCRFILDKVDNDMFEYETDGLIFTPSILPVGANKIGEYVEPVKATWEHSFKWKPPIHNTIDFLISIKKTSNGQDFVGNIFQSGVDMSSTNQLTQYKTLILRVGYDEDKHGFINPCQDIIDNKMPEYGERKRRGQNYYPMQFFPTNPPDINAGICNILLQNGNGGEKYMFTEANEIIEDNMIVEFTYNLSREEGWRWVPVRVRHDKTSQLRSGEKNFGNAFHVANSNWRVIHNPITKEMISNGNDIPELYSDDEVYYNKNSKTTSTRALRDFHNLFVKKLLITSVSNRGDILVDLAVGKGGDLPKWIFAKLKFVFGIDISPDNIDNRIDGVCARYLRKYKETRNMPKGLFVVGNSAINIRNTDAIVGEKNKQITNAIFGVGPKDKEVLGEGVYNQYGVANEGFNVCSIQFAMHYMFETQKSLCNFLQNVSEVTKLGGYFIATCYDGKTVFNMLKEKDENESVVIMENDSKMWELTKRYDRNSFEDNVSSLGYAIDVYQESINKTFREYLVNYEYLTRLFEDYGFVLITKEEAQQLGLPSGSGLFDELYQDMVNEIERDKYASKKYGTAPNMTSSEKRISYLNRYFVYKKIRNVDAKKVTMSLLNQSYEEIVDDNKESELAKKTAISVIKQQDKTSKTKSKKTRKLVIRE